MPVDPRDYLYRRILPLRDRALDVSARARQDNAADEDRQPNFTAGYAKELFRNKVGLCGEVVIMLWCHGLYPQMPVHWLEFKTGAIHLEPDIRCGTGWHTIIEVKTNEFAHETNYLLLRPKDLPRDRSRDHWIFIHCFVESYRTWELDKEGRPLWKFTCPNMVNTGWCFGWEARQMHDPDGPVKGPLNIPESALRPMYELERLIKLRERYGPADGELKWERGERA